MKKQFALLFCLLLTVLTVCTACEEKQPDTTDIYPWPTDTFFAELPAAAEKVTFVHARNEEKTAYSVLIEKMEYTDFYRFIETIKAEGFTATQSKGLDHADTSDPELKYAFCELTRDDMIVTGAWSTADSNYRFGNNAVVLEYFKLS